MGKLDTDWLLLLVLTVGGSRTHRSQRRRFSSLDCGRLDSIVRLLQTLRVGSRTMSRLVGCCVGVLFLLVLNLHCIAAIDRTQLFPFGATQGDERLEVGDDVSSPEVQLRTPIVFYDDVYSSLYVSLDVTIIDIFNSKHYIDTTIVFL